MSKLANTSGANEAELCDQFGIELEDLEKIMLNANWERCPECDWWCECGELVDEESEPCACEQCRGGKRG